MKFKNILTMLLIPLILVSCAPEIIIVAPTETPVLTSTFTAIPTSTITAIPTSTTTPIPIPVIDIEGLTVPDPHFSNPNFFDIDSANSPIVKFAKAFNIKPIDVSTGLSLDVEQGFNGNNIVVMATNDGTILLMATKWGKYGFAWQEATPGYYWGSLGKYIGASIRGQEWKLSNNSAIFLQYFSHGGILGITTQVRPGPEIVERRPSKASPYLLAAKRSEMAFMFTYVVEPGKFPENTTVENVDQWLNRRLSEMSDVIIQNKSSKMVYLNFNEATNEMGGWNNDDNPLKDKYGDKWLGEYIYQALLIPIQHNLIPNKDYILLNNENSMFSRITQQFIHTKLIEARIYAFEKLISDSTMAAKLREMGINKADDINIVLGTETYVNLDHKYYDGVNFIIDASPEQIDALANYFSDLGGIIMTEVSPHGTVEQKREFFIKITNTMRNNPNIHGILLWNIFENSDDATDNFSQSPNLLFDSLGNPVQLYYALLHQ